MNENCENCDSNIPTEVQIGQISPHTFLMTTREGSHKMTSPLFQTMRHIQGLKGQRDGSLDGGRDL